MKVYFSIEEGNYNKTENACRRLLKMSSDLSKHFILVVPEQSALKYELELVNSSDNHGIINIEVLSFTRLAYRIMEEAGDISLPILDDMGKTMVLKRLLAENNDKLTVYKSKDKSVGFIDQIKSIISELLIYRVTPEMIKPKKDPETLYEHKLADVYVIYSAFLKFIEGKYATSESLPEFCFKHIQKSKVLKDCTFMFDGFTGFIPIQYKFIDHLMSVSGNMYINLAGDNSIITDSEFISPSDYEGYQGIFSMSVETLVKVSEIAAKNNTFCYFIKTDDNTFELNESLTHLCKNVFRNNDVSKISSGNSVYVNSFKNKKQEAMYAAATISDLVRNQGYDYKDLAIVSSDLEGYSMFIKDALSAYGISYYIDSTRSLESNALISFIHLAMRVIETGFSRESVVAFIKSPLLSYSSLEVSMTENYLKKYNYSGIRRYREEFVYNKRFKDEFDLAPVNRVRSDLVEKFDILPKGLSNINTHEFIVSLYNFLEAYNVKEALVKLAEISVTNNVSHYEELEKEYSKAYEAVIGIFERIDTLLKDECISYKEFDDLFMMGVRKTKLGMIPGASDVVIVGDIWRTRLKNVKTVFMLGMNEGAIPRLNSENLILNSSDKVKLKLDGIELAPVIKEEPYREEFYVYLMLTKPSESIYLSYLTVSNDGKELRPSYMLEKVTKLFSDIKENNYQEDISHLLGYDNGLSYFLDNYNSDDKLYKALKGYYRSIGNTTEQKATSIDKRINEPADRLDPSDVNSMYDKCLQLSASKLESYSQCPYNFFVTYGLGLESDGEAEPGNIDYGNIVHKALKKLAKNIKGGLYNQLNNDDISVIVNNCLEEVAADYNDDIYHDTKRIEFTLNKLKPVMDATATAIATQLRQGNYDILNTEEPFKISGTNYLLKGVVDRIDTYKSGDSTFIKIVDYKTSEHKWSYVDLKEGLNIQLPLYLSAAIDKLGKGSLPGAMFYQEVGNPTEEINTIDEAESKKIKGLRPVGVGSAEDIKLASLDKALFVNNVMQGKYKSDVIRYVTLKEGGPDSNTLKGNKWVSEADLNKVIDYTRNKVNKLADEIMSGNIAVNPYRKDDTTACKWCENRGICGFDEKVKHFKYREIPKGELAETEAFIEITGEEKDNGQ